MSSDKQQVIENDNGSTLMIGIKTIALGLLTATGVALLMTKVTRASGARKSNKESLKEGSAENIAKLIKMAFENDGWPGTDEESLRELFQKMPSQDFYEAVRKEYEKQNSTLKSKASLERDLQDELNSSEFKEIMLIKAGKPQSKGGKVSVAQQHSSWARRLKAAFDINYGPIPGTDEPAIRAVMNEIPTKTAWVQVKLAYRKEYNRDLEADLKSELEFWEYSDYMKIINAKKP